MNKLIKLIPFSITLALGLLAALFSLLSPPRKAEASPSACVAGPHTGVITTQDWCPQDNPHILTGDVTVNSGVTLALQPGVIVQGNNGTRIAVVGAGILQAVGTASEPITLTSSIDSAPGQWEGLYIEGQAALKYVTMRFAGQNDGWARASIRLNTGELTLENSQVLSSSIVGWIDHSIHLINSSQATINGTLFADIGDSTDDFGVYVHTSADVITITNSIFQNHSGYPIRVPAAHVHRITGNTFSGNNPNRILVQNGNVADGTHLAPQTGLQAYELNGRLAILVGQTLFIDPDVMLMARSGTLIHVLGYLEAIGTPTQPITFTSSADSAPDQWAGIYIQEGAGNFAYATLRYAGQNNGYGSTRSVLILQNTSGAAMSLDHVSLHDNAATGVTDSGLHISGAHVNLNQSVIGSNGDQVADYGVSLGSGSALTVTHSSIENNAGIGLYADRGQVRLICATVSGSGSDGIRLTGSSSVFTSLSAAFFANAGVGLNNTSSATAYATYNWWGDASGPGGVGFGSGDEVSANVLFDPWLTQAGCFVYRLFMPLLHR